MTGTVKGIRNKRRSRLNDIVAHHVSKGGHRPTACKQDVKDLLRNWSAQLGDDILLPGSFWILVPVVSPKIQRVDR